MKDAMTCMTCGRYTRHPFGRWCAGVTCSKPCNDAYCERQKEANEATRLARAKQETFQVGHDSEGRY